MPQLCPALFPDSSGAAAWWFLRSVRNWIFPSNAPGSFLYTLFSKTSSLVFCPVFWQVSSSCSLMLALRLHFSWKFSVLFGCSLISKHCLVYWIMWMPFLSSMLLPSWGLWLAYGAAKVDELLHFSWCFSLLMWCCSLMSGFQGCFCITDFEPSLACWFC